MDSANPVNVDYPAGCDCANNSPYEADVANENSDPKARTRGGSRGGRNGGMRGGRGGRRREGWMPPFHGGYPYYSGYGAYFPGPPPPFGPHFRGNPPPHPHHPPHHTMGSFMMPPPPPPPPHFIDTPSGSAHINRSEPPNSVSKPILTYFDAPGLAEPIRLCFLLGGIPFEDRRISPEEWHNKYKSYSNTGQCPILEVDGRQIPQSQAILHYAASRAGLLPRSDEDQLTASMIIGRLNDSMDRVRRTAYQEPTVETRKNKIRELSRDALTPVLESIETLLTEGRSTGEIGQFFLGGDDPSYVDLVLAHLFNEQDAGSFLFDTSPFPTLRAIQAAVNNHPAIRAYHRSRETKKPKLVYGRYFGLAHSIRWTFSLGNIEFEDVHMSDEEFEEVKKTDKYLKLPYLEIDGKKYTESTGILWYAAKLAGLVPRNEINVAYAWSYCRTFEAAITQFASAASETDTEKCCQLLRSLDKMIATTQDQEGHCVASTLTFADIYVAAMYYQTHHPYSPEKLRSFPSDINLPHIEKTTRMVLSMPIIKGFEYKFTQQKPELKYFDLTGRAECIRRCFNYGGIDFADTRIPFDKWQSEEKAKSPTGHLPLLVVDGKLICETSAILAYAAERAELVPMTYLGRAIAESIRSKYQDVIHIQAAIYKLSEEAKAEFRTSVSTGSGDEVLKVVDKLCATCQHDKGYLVEGKLTYIDIYIHSELQYHGDLKLLPDDWKTKYPALGKCYDLIETKYLERLSAKTKSKQE